MFVLVRVDLARLIQDEVPMVYVLFAEMFFFYEATVGINYKLEICRKALNFKGFKLSRTKTKYMECKFSNRWQRTKELLIIEREVVERDHFRKELITIVGEEVVQRDYFLIYDQLHIIMEK